MKNEDMVVEMDIGKIELSNTNPRKALDKDGLKDLAKSIEQFGVIQSLIVRKKGKGHELVAGERRLKAAKLAGLKTVPVIVRDLDDVEALAVQLAENLDREDLDPLEEAQGFKQLQEAGWTQERIGERFSTSQEQVSNRIRLLRLPEKLHDIISRGIITPGHAKQLLRLETKKEQTEIAEDLTRYAMRPSVKETEKAVNRRLRRAEEEEQFKEVYKEAKVKHCPQQDCGKKAIGLDTDFKKPVLTCCQHYIVPGHRWRPDTGEIVLTKYEREEEETRKQRAKEAAARRKKTGEKGGGHVPTMPAWIFTKATKQQWAKALLEHMADGIDSIEADSGGLYVSAAERDIADRTIEILPVALSDGETELKTKIVIGNYKSTPSQDDDVARGEEEVDELKAIVQEILDFQKKKIGMKQTLKDVMLKEFDGFELGGKVKVAKEFSIKSYRGAGAEIVGFDEKGHAVLNYSKTRKVVLIEDLESIEKKEPVEKRVHCDSCGCDNVPDKDKDGNLFCGSCEALIEVRTRGAL